MKAWQKKEKRDAEAFDGVRTKSSGNLWYSPGDFKSDLFLGDSKDTSKKSYSISLETWDKLFEEALFSFRIPLLSLKIRQTELVVLSRTDFLKILEHTDLKKIVVT